MKRLLTLTLCVAMSLSCFLTSCTDKPDEPATSDTTDGETVYVWKALLNGVQTTVETKESWTARTMYVDYRIDTDGFYVLLPL